MSRQTDKKQIEQAEERVRDALRDLHNDKCSVADVLAVIEEVDSQNGVLEYLEKISIEANPMV
jgi:regulator of RNase E activity RraB